LRLEFGFIGGKPMGIQKECAASRGDPAGRIRGKNQVDFNQVIHKRWSESAERLQVE
jgi:hypothetical protein